jgi:D-3-phosphoglycerate dehydrogenase / 2-oxoglutarate reductase
MRKRASAAATGKVVITDSPKMLEAAVATLEAAHADFEQLPDGLSPEDVARRSADADVLIVTAVPFRKATLRLLRKVGLIVRCGVGVDSIDITAATDQGIWVTNIPDYAVHEVADHTILLLLAAARHLTHFQRSVAASGWGPTGYPAVRRLAGLRLGIIGLGRIGSQVARRARALGMEVVACSPHMTAARLRTLRVTGVSLSTLLRTSEVISLHAPLTPATTHLLDQRAFARMRRGVIILNTARGGLIDLAALESALDQGIVAAAALDVLEREPPPDFSLPMFQRDTVIVTPHIAWYSQDAVRELGVRAAEEALRYLRGEKPAALRNPKARSGRRRPLPTG